MFDLSPRQKISSDSPWEDQVGYSRAVKHGPHIWISGTTAVDDNGQVEGDEYQQTVTIFEKFKAALTQMDSNLDAIVRTRIYVTNIQNWRAVAKAHAEFMGRIKPAATMVEASRFIDPHILVEIEADGFVGYSDGKAKSSSY